MVSSSTTTPYGDTVNVDLGDRSYPIYIKENLLADGAVLGKHVPSKKALIVTNTKVGPLYSHIVKKQLEAKGVEVYEVVLPDGEEYKTMESIMTVMDAAMEHKLDRKSVMIALGGGVIGDMCGFAAAIFQRGVRFVQVPTTLMAMVDSAVGGKTAVNHPKGKNMIGAFYQPEAVIADISTLSTLPEREFRSGLSEVIKYGLIKDPELFVWLEENIDDVLARKQAALAHIIRRSCEIKAEVVAADERESGMRALLNLGHTFGHAIEAGFGYGTWLHGEAVSAGTVMAADFSSRLNLVDKSVYDRVKRLFQRCHLPVDLHNSLAVADVGNDEYEAKSASLTKDAFLELMSFDKKVADGKLSLVLMEGPLGKSVVTSKYDATLLASTVSTYCKH